jgi:acylglycerol lipase
MNVGLPALLLLGGKDEIVPNARVQRVFDRLSGPRQVIEYPDGWHLLFRDLQAETVWRDVAEWSVSIPRIEVCGTNSG